MWTVLAVFIALVLGFVCGLFFGPNFLEEFSQFKTFLFGELAKLHGKLDEILASVKK